MKKIIEQKAPMQKARIDLHRSETEDIVSDKYLVHLSNSIDALSNDFVKYYLVTDIDDHSEYYGIVFDRKFIPDYQTIHLLKTIQQDHINNVVSYGITRLSNNHQAYFVVVVQKYELETTLAAWYEQGNTLNKEQVLNKLLPSISNSVLFCEKRDIACGNICPSNIIMLESGEFMLREPFIAPKNYYQHERFLPLELSRCLPLARVAHTSADIYALGVSLVFALGYDVHSLGQYNNREEYCSARLELGSFRVITGDARLNDNVKDLLKGMLADTERDRWSGRRVVEWCEGGSRVKAKKISTLSSGYITFNGKNYTTIAGICAAFLDNWDQALNFICDERFQKWVTHLSLTDEQQTQLEIIYNSLTSNVESKKYYTQQSNEDRNFALTKLLLLLGDGYIIHTKDISYSLLNLEQFVSIIDMNDGRTVVKSVLSTIAQEYDIISDIIKVRSLEAVHLSDIDHTLQTISSSYKDDKYAISGIEKTLYMLNANVACQSVLLVNTYVNDIASLLVELDMVCHNNPDSFNLDRNIIAFIASKVGIKSDSDFLLLKDFPQLAEDPIIIGLPIICMAQKEVPEIELVHLNYAVSERLIEFIDQNIHNQKLQKALIRQLLDEGERGNLSSMLELVSDTAMYENDAKGYNKSLKEIQELNDKIESISQMNMIYSQGVFLGQKLTVLLSYILCLAVIVILMV